MKEPSVLDYVKSLLMPWKGERITIPEPEELAAEGEEARQEAPFEGTAGQELAEVQSEQVETGLEAPRTVRKARLALPYRSLGAVLLAVAAQFFLDTANHRLAPALVLYSLSIGLLVWALIRREWQVLEMSADAENAMPVQVRWGVLGFSVPVFAVAYLAFGGNRFSIYNLVIGLLLVGYLVYAFYAFRTGGEKIGVPFWRFSWPLQIQIRPWHLLLAGVCLVILFFRFYRLDSVPNEMISDHAEKLFDVGDVLAGQTSIFFPRNSGREAFQFYLTALVSQVFGTGISFLSLKIGTSIAGLVTLVYVYLLGAEIANRRVGLFAMALTGVAYWPIVITRIALRFALYPLFVAPVLYYLVRGLRRQNRNDFIWAGIALGLGLHGYSPMRIVPFVLVILVLLYLLHRQASAKRTGVLVGLGIIALVSLAVLLPLVRFALEDPRNLAMLGFRAFSRLSTSETVYPAPPLQIFFDNLWKAWVMMFYDNGEIWAHSIPHRPALDVISAALYLLGTVACIYKYVRTRHWIYPVLILSVPLLMMPSILSLAFPGENPSLNRTGGAYIPIFLLAALGLEEFTATLSARLGERGPAWARGAAAAILVLVALLNYDLVFNQYAQNYAQSSWNTSELGKVAQAFKETFGEDSTVYVVGYPYWVDGRLVAINAGDSRVDYSLFSDQIPLTLQRPGAKLFLLSPQDQNDIAAISSLYPTGQVSLRAGQYDKNFVTYIVPGEGMH